MDAGEATLICCSGIGFRVDASVAVSGRLNGPFLPQPVNQTAVISRPAVTPNDFKDMCSFSR
jgi:hypothetical protein